MAVAFRKLGAEDAAGGDDGIFPEKDELPGGLVFHEKLELILFFERADEGGGAELDVLFREFGFHAVANAPGHILLPRLTPFLSAGREGGQNECEEC